MKSKDKKSKAAEFIKKYQLGGLQPLPLPYPKVESMNPSNAELAIQDLNNLRQPKPLTPYQPVPEPSFLEKGIPFISPAINLGVGIANLFQAGKAKKKQRAYERAFQKELSQRQEESRVNDYYYVPQQYASSTQPSFQLGGSLDLFAEYYNQMEGQNKTQQQRLEQYYNDKNQQLINDYQNKKSAGFSNIFQGVMNTLPLLQEGGKIESKTDWGKWDRDSVDILRKRAERRRSDHTTTRTIDPQNPKDVTIIPTIKQGSGKSKSKDRFREMQDGGEYDPTQDIYSDQFQFNYEDLAPPREVQDELSQVEIEDKIDQTLMDWIFEEPEDYNYEDVEGIEEMQGSPYEGKIKPVVEFFKTMGLNPSSVDEGTHNTGSKHYSGNALDLGLNTTFGGDVTKMYKFKQWYETEGKDKFPGLKLIDETKRPNGQQVWTGPHYHLEF